MTEKDTIPDIHKLSGIFLDTLKEVAKSGNVLNISNFSQFLAKKQVIRNLLKQANKPKEVELKTKLKSKLDILQAEITEHENREKINRKKLFDLEIELDKEKDINKRTIFILLNLCRKHEDSSLWGILDEYKELVINEADLKIRDKALTAINNQILKTDLSRGEETETENEEDFEKKSVVRNSKMSVFRKILGESSEINLKPIKKACLKALDELRIILGNDFNEQIAVIKDRIKNCEDIDYLLSLRKQMVGIIKSYAEIKQEEKNEITGFIKIIGTKLVDMERDIYLAFSNSDEAFGEDIKFNETVEQKINDIGKSINENKDFGSIKSFILSGLNSLTDTLRKKQDEYIERIEKNKKDKAKLQQYFGKVINSVIDQNKILIERNQKDPLTNIYNRTTFEELFTIEMQRYQRYKDTFSFIMFDIDQFKNVNDLYGHEAGDKVLKGISNCIKEILRESDVFARYGGEEFVILLPKATVEKCANVAEKIRSIVQNTEFSYENVKVPITISIGVTEIQPSDTDFNIIFKRVDSYMYKAKNEGRNKVISDLNVANT